MAGSDLRFAFYGDDFTGATDTLATLASAGLKTVLFMGPPTPAQLACAGLLDCLGIAGASRSMGAAEQEAELEPVGRFFAGLGAPVIHYKTCSTFDSSPDIGSIGVALRSLRRRLDVSSFVPIVGGQPSLGRYCVFGNLFAAFQSGGEVYRLDRHPTMSRHPVTPMHEADLRLHLARQGLPRLGLIPYPSYDLPAQAFDRILDDEAAAQPDGVLFDVAQAGQLASVGRAIWRRAAGRTVLAAGPSSVAQALIAHWRASGETDTSSRARPAALPAATTPVFVFSGSRSPLTARQIQAANSYERIPLSPRILMRGEGDGAALARIASALSGGANVLAYLTDEASEAVTSAADLAKACAAFIARVLEAGRPRRVGVAGGDTSSYAVKALDGWGLSYLGQLDPGVALCRVHADDPGLDGVEIMLKGGQMGSPSIFEKLLAPG
ncbi:four-carbon acid sugar kinase family protein [Parapusillimonas granuli]|uniref:Four-carbon acid sugar kinase family protein n=1 Tax=Parapusillimonas granuli TaxID=380911 RepID=A0A853G2G2_9BURK|nr:four-carbon acid sugar kinase family protein [Parapusillimonas granuli]MBB5214631.1 uncharacterized protein YgbK (DUF1537 family) [Parapusillimonas granuli]NYT48961.1 four-carbon acid sugar kinase family protein [Parapusillimonas granuli]